MRKRIRSVWLAFVLLCFCLSLAACSEDAAPPDASLPRITKLSDATFRLVVIGDFGSGDLTERTVARGVRSMAEEEEVDALVTTGDNVYMHGEVSSFPAAWIGPYGWTEDRGLDVIASLGNHDIQTDGGEAVMDMLGMPGPYYVDGVGDADIFVLDSNHLSDAAQLEWFERALSGSTAAWKIVVFHHPAFSCAVHDSTPEVIAGLVPLLEAQGVDLVLNGHDHNYQRFAPRNGVTYVVTGGGGQKLYRLDECSGVEPQLVAGDATTHHFLYIQGDTDELSVDAIGVDGAVIDYFELTDR